MAEETIREIGDFVLCEWDEGKLTKHKITDKKHGASQSGVMYRVSPALRLSSENHWIDSDWFFDPA